jgi:hypothetical protein
MKCARRSRALATTRRHAGARRRTPIAPARAPDPLGICAPRFLRRCAPEDPLKSSPPRAMCRPYAAPDRPDGLPPDRWWPRCAPLSRTQAEALGPGPPWWSWARQEVVPLLNVEPLSAANRCPAVRHRVHGRATAKLQSRAAPAKLASSSLPLAPTQANRAARSLPRAALAGNWQPRRPPPLAAGVPARRSRSAPVRPTEPNPSDP